MQSELDQCCAMLLQPLVVTVYCRVSKAVDGTHFVRKLISSDRLALQRSRFDKCLEDFESLKTV